MQQVEISRIEQELSWVAWLGQNKIDIVLLDLDDTISATRKIIGGQIWACARFLNQHRPDIEVEDWIERIDQANNRLFEKLSVRPERWGVAMTEIGQKVGLDVAVEKRATDILMEIYKIKTDFLPGAEAGLNFLRRTETPIGIVTHANEEWTWKKFNQLRLFRFLDWSEVFVVSEERHKNEVAWEAAMDYFRTTPQRCAVIGNSPRSDMKPAENLAVRHRFLITGEYCWNVQNAPLANDTRRIASLDELSGVGLELIHPGIT